MSPARPACAPQLLSATGAASDAEFARVLRTADPGPALDGPLTFLPAANLSPADWLRAWQAWQQTTLAPVLAPALLDAAGHAARGAARELRALDLALDASLAPAAARRSTAAGGRLLPRLAAARGERSLSKLRQWHAAGETPAHFAAIFASGYALFHLPLPLLLPAYAYWEWCAASAACPSAGAGAADFADQTPALCRLAQQILSSRRPPPYAAENFPAASGAS